MKLQTQRKKLIFHGSVMAGVTVALFAVYIFVSGMEEDKIQKRSRVSGEISRVNSQIQKLDSTLKKAKESIKLYEQLQQDDDSGDASLSRKNITSTLNALRTVYKLDTLSLRMTPIAELEQSKYVTTTTRVIQTEITLSFSGMTDEMLLAFLNEVMGKLPGYTRLLYLDMKRERPIDNDFLLSVGRGEYPALVSGEVTFHLLGMKRIKAEEEKAVPAGQKP